MGKALIATEERVRVLCNKEKVLSLLQLDLRPPLRYHRR